MPDLAPSKKNRLIFIDVMRGIAVLWMIETHVVDANLFNYLKTGFFYTWLNISNGYVAVAFIFCAGCGFWLAAMRKGDDYRSFKAPIWIYLRRLGFIFLMAYWLQLPTLSFKKFSGMSMAELIRFFQCDVLNAIVISAVLALIIFLIIRNNKILPYIFLIIAILFIFLTPWIRSLNAMSFLPPYIATYLMAPPVSKFPLFPWSAYYFAGAAFTALFYKIEDKKKFSIIVAVSGFVVAALLFATRHITEGFMGIPDWWQGSPQHTFFRLGGTVMTFSILYLIEDFYKNRKIGDVMRLCGQESLFVYVFHLMIVYGSVVNFGLRQFVGNNVNWYGVFLMTLTLCAVNYWLAYIWNGFKGKSPEMSRRVIMALSLFFMVVFIFNPYG